MPEEYEVEPQQEDQKKVLQKLEQRQQQQ